MLWHALGENRKIALFHENAVSEKARLVMIPGWARP